MIDRVDPLTEIVEIRIAQTESGLADVADYYADARRKFLVPDFSMLQSIAQALEPVFCIVGPDDAMHYQIGILLQKVAQEETTDESGHPGQQDLAKISRGHRIGRRSLTDAVWTNRRRVSTSLWQCGGKDPTSGATAVSATVFSIMFPFLKIVQIWIYSLHHRQVFCLCIHGESEGRQSMLNSIFIVAKFIGY